MQKYYAILSGASAATASLFGKLCGLPAFEDFVILRVLCFAAMILMNTFVWNFYVKALQFSKSTLSTTVLSAAANYLLSGFIGAFIFKEDVSFLWVTGSTLIVSGLVLILKNQTDCNTNFKIKDN